MSEPITVSVSWSTKAEAARAGKEAAENALAQLSSCNPQLAMVFASSWFDQVSLLQGVRSALGNVPLMGSSTAGEIVAEGPISHSCVVVLIASRLLACKIGMGADVDRAPRDAGQQAAYAAMRDFRGTPRIGFLFVGDGLLTSYADVARGIQEVLGTGSLIVGGMAGDDLRFAHTYQYMNGHVLSRAVVGVLLGGQGKLGVGIQHGFAPISKPRQITRARANILYELDRRPAASVYEEYFGAEIVQRMRQERLTRPRIAYPLGIQCETANQWLLRNVVSFQDDGGLACSGEILEGAWLQLMIGSRELALEAARQAAQQAIRMLNQIACVLVFNSASRRTLLGPQYAAAEVACIREAVGPSTPMAGCYTYGEQGPFGTASISGRTATQTGSVLIVALGT